MQRVKVSRRFQIAVPSEVRRSLGIEAGDSLIVEVRGDHVILMREPKDWAASLIGLHKEIWEDVDTEEYLRGERAAWAE